MAFSNIVPSCFLVFTVSNLTRLFVSQRAFNIQKPKGTLPFAARMMSLLRTLSSLLLLFPSPTFTQSDKVYPDSTQAFPVGTFSLTAPGPFCTFESGVNMHLNTDGNILIYRSNESSSLEWTSNKYTPNCNGEGCQLYFQTDGNLVSYAGSTPLFYTATAGRGALMACSWIVPYLMLFDAQGTLIWNADVFPGEPIYQEPNCPTALTKPWLCVY